MADLTSRPLIVFKGILFLLIALASAALVIVHEGWTWELPAMALLVWSSCRFYYFLFYVLEKYVGVEGRYAGLFDLARRLASRRKVNAPP